MRLKSIKLSSKIVTKKIEYQDFNKLTVSDDIKVYVVFSEEKNEIILKTNSNLVDHIDIAYKGDELVVTKNLENTLLKGKEISNLYITGKPFFKFQVFDDSLIQVESLIVNKYANFKISNDSFFKCNVDVETIKITIKDDSKALVKGNVENLNIKLLSDSKLENYDLVVRNLNAKLSGDSKLKLTVTRNIEVSASGDSELRYRGDANVNIEKVSKGSSVKRSKDSKKKRDKK